MFINEYTIFGLHDLWWIINRRVIVVWVKCLPYIHGILSTIRRPSRLVKLRINCYPIFCNIICVYVHTLATFIVFTKRTRQLWFLFARRCCTSRSPHSVLRLRAEYLRNIFVLIFSVFASFTKEIVPSIFKWTLVVNTNILFKLLTDVHLVFTVHKMNVTY